MRNNNDKGGKRELRRGRPRELVRAERKAAISTFRGRVAEPLEQDITVGDLFVGEYLPHLARQIEDGLKAPSTIDDAISAYDLYVQALAEIAVVALTVSEVAAWVLTLRAMAPAPAAKYVLKIHGFLRSALALARARGLIASNPAAHLPPGVLPENETRPGFDPALELLTVPQFVRLIADRGFPLYRRLFWALLGTTGMREGEAIALRISDIDRSTQPLWSIAITKSYCAKSHRLVATKTRQHKLAPAHADLLVPLIEEWLSLGFRELHDRAPEPDDLLIAHAYRGGGPDHYPDNSALMHWKEALAAHGLAPRRLHALRHFFDTTLEELGADPEAIREITHPPKRAKGGYGTYRHVSWARRCEAVSKLEAKLPSQLPLFDRNGGK